MTLDFESDQFLELLTDALRAGPGSPAWHEAVSRIKLSPSAGGGRVQEYQALLAAREHLESGKGYRQIRAGPRFTRKVMAAVAEEHPGGGSGRGGPALPTVVALLAGTVVLGAAVLITWLLISSAGPARQTLADLKSQTFSHEISSGTFADGLPQQWREIGSLAGKFGGEFRPPAVAPGDAYAGCGIVLKAPLPADRPTAIDVTLRLAEPSEGVIPQIFVTDRPDFSADRGISSHELAWDLPPQQVHNKTFWWQKVELPDGTFAATVEAPHRAHDTLEVRLSFDADFILVDCDGQRIYAGPHQLAPDKPRYVGVRFLRRGEMKSWNIPAVLSVRISQG